MRSHLARGEIKSCTSLWREVHLEVKMYKTHHSRTTWKLRCPKSARRCGAKHISKSKCTKHTMLGPLLEVEMSKKCIPLWRETHFEIKMCKTHQVPLYYTTLHYTTFHYTSLHYAILHYNYNYDYTTTLH